jgi:hypothetical protein
MITSTSPAIARHTQSVHRTNNQQQKQGKRTKHPTVARVSKRATRAADQSSRSGHKTTRVKPPVQTTVVQAIRLQQFGGAR